MTRTARSPRLAWLLSLWVALFAVACDDDESTTAPPATGDLVATASADARLATVVSLIERAGLVEALQGDGPFTAFLPIDSAFEGVDAAALSDAELADILQRHVVEGRFEAAQVVETSELSALNGAALRIVVDGGNVTINGAKVMETDIAASNGVIHIVESIIPPPMEEEMPGTIAEIAGATDDLSTLVQLATDAGLVGALEGDGPLTVFAPNNDAFDAVPQALLDTLAEDQALLTLVLTYHVAAGAIDASQVATRGTIDTLAEQALTVSTEDGVMINDANVVTPDVMASNGIVHIIDAVLIPELPEAPGNIAEVATENGNFTTLLAAVEAAGLVEALTDPEADLTVFAPTDAAFGQIAEADLNALIADVPALTNVLQYHIVAGALSAEEVIAQMTLDALNGGQLVVENTEDGVRINGALVQIADVPASNGVIHAIDMVLMPPAEAGDIIETATENGSFGTLLAAVDAAGLTDTLKGEGPFTVFAPTDAAFAALPEGTVESLLEAENRDQLIDILTYHVVDEALDAEAVTGASLIGMLNGVFAKVEESEGGFTIGGARIAMTDVPASNGVIHVIDAVILPPGNIAEVAEANGNFTTLLTALDAAGLVGAVTGEDPVTVFAPTDAAFAALPEGTLDTLLAEEDRATLTSILTYHVVGGAQPAAEVLDVGMFETVNGFNVFARATDEGAFINEAGIVITDIPTRNGIIHVIDAVIMPPNNLVDVAADAGMFNTLIAAVEAAGLVEAVTDANANLAIFAPTDEAFAALPEGTLDALLADPAALADILLFHAVGGMPMAADVISEDFLVTLQGAGVPIMVGDDGVMIGDANIVITDVPAPNGVIHVIDAVILPPPDLIDVATAAGNFGTLLAAVEAAGLTQAIRDGEFTLFAPTDEAFAALPEGTVDMLLEDIPALTRILQYHVVPGFQFSPTVVAAGEFNTLLEGVTLPIMVSEDGAVMAGGAPVSATDIFAGNGVIHVVDQVIMPPMN